MTRLNAASEIGIGSRGFTLIEVMVALVILGVGLLGGVGALHETEQSLGRSQLTAHALALAEARLEAKRAGRWEDLLQDDVDGDGVPEIVMQDSGAQGDRMAGDGVFTGAADGGGVRLIWTVELPSASPLLASPSAWIEVQAGYVVAPGQWKEVRLRTLRANPRYIGGR